MTETTAKDGEYTVNSIVDHAHHTDGGDTEFRVRYEGYDSNEDGWFTADQIPNCQSLIDSYISENREYYEKGFVISGAVNVLREFQEDTLLFEQESHTMRQAARAHASALPAYPVFQNKEQYDQLDSEEQLEYREQATLASEARRRMLMDTVGCSYSTARDSLRSGTKDLDKVVDHALYMTYTEPNSDTQPMSDPNTDPDGTPTLTQVYLAAEPAPRHIMDRTDPAALLGSALSPTADDSIKQGWIQDTALSTMLRCSYSAEDSIMGADAVGDMLLCTYQGLHTSCTTCTHHSQLLRVCSPARQIQSETCCGADRQRNDQRVPRGTLHANGGGSRSAYQASHCITSCSG